MPLLTQKAGLGAFLKNNAGSGKFEGTGTVGKAANKFFNPLKKKTNMIKGEDKGKYF